MSERAHTPGPWRWVNSQTDEPRKAGELRGSLRTVATFPVPLETWTLPKWILDMEEAGTASDEETEANLQLIAAAPEMLEALKAQNDATEYAKALSALAEDGTKLTPGHIEEGRRRIERAQVLCRAAIAKAEGR